MKINKLLYSTNNFAETSFMLIVEYIVNKYMDVNISFNLSIQQIYNLNCPSLFLNLASFIRLIFIE